MGQGGEGFLKAKAYSSLETELVNRRGQEGGGKPKTRQSEGARPERITQMPVDGKWFKQQEQKEIPKGGARKEGLPGKTTFMFES